MFNFTSLYGYEEIFDIFEAIFQVFSAFSLVCGVFSILLYVVQGIAMLSMANKCGIKNGWLAFIPVANCYIFGKIAEKYIRKDGKKSAKYGIILPIFCVLKFIATVALTVIFIISLISIISNVELALEMDSQLTLSMFSSFVSVIVAYFISLAIAIIYLVYYYIALWRIFSIFNKSNSTLYTVLSVIFSFLAPIFMFIVRNNNPTFDSNEQSGYFEPEKEF